MKIDFVITWVDGSDEKWIEDYNRYSNKPIDKHRYRDWGLLKYWFRAVEKYASWVNKVYFVTYGHIPQWLDTSYSKLVIVKHSDFIEKKYLPTFNSCVIELNLHKIKGLSENFVYFNDDMFLNNFVNKEDFFKNDLPCDSVILSHIWSRGLNSTCINYNCSYIVNKYYKIKKLKKQRNVTIKRDIKNIVRKICFFNKKNMMCIIPQHVPTSYLKKTFSNVWDKEKLFLEDICSHKFRTNNDVSQWIFQFWQIASGNFVSRDLRFSKCYQIETNTLNETLDKIKKGKYKLICLNDGEKTKDYEINMKRIEETFKEIYPNKSQFEKKEN